MKYLPIFFCLALAFSIGLTKGFTQSIEDEDITRMLPAVLEKHRAFVSLPNVASSKSDMFRNIDFVKPEFERLGFETTLLQTSTLPVFLAKKEINPTFPTLLFYFHLDGQPVAPENWDQKDPFIPVLKEVNDKGEWSEIEWSSITKSINPDWRIFGRAAADDKAPITMMLTALKMKQNGPLKYNIKIVLDLQEEMGSEAFLSTLEKYKEDYSADYMIIMDGPAHNTNKPTLTFGCRGNAKCSITVYGSKLPQHSGHYGNYSPNPIFSMAHLLSSMKDDRGRVTIENYYDGIDLDQEVKSILTKVPDNDERIKEELVIHQFDDVGSGYQESLQYPSLNVRHIETSWKGPGLKTVIPEYVTAHLDVRLVMETDGAKQIEKIKRHMKKEGFLVLDRDPTDEERLSNAKIAKFIGGPGVNAFRTDVNAPIGKKLRTTLTQDFGEEPVTIRTMGGTVPIIPAIKTLNIPAIIVPMVNMDNNQHNPNENIRIGNITQGIKICLAILSMDANGL